MARLPPGLLKPGDPILNALPSARVKPFVERLALAVLVSAAAWAEPLDPLLKAVEARYNRAQSLQVLFHETYSGPGRARRQEYGKLRLRKPGRMRWDYEAPPGKLFLSDGKSLFLYLPAANRVEKMKMKESEDMRAPLAFLLGKLDFSREFRNLSARTEGSETVVSAEPAAGNLPYTAVEFSVAAGHRIQRVQVTGFDRSVLEFRFEQEVLNPPLDQKLFRFVAPAGAEIVEAGR